MKQEKMLLHKPLDERFEERVRASFNRQKFMHLIGARLVTVTPGFCEIHLAFKDELAQQDGYFHGGIIGTIADNAGGYAAYSLMPPGSAVLTVEYKLNIVAPGDGELLMARGQVAKAGRTLTVCNTDVLIVKSGREKLCATSLMTLMRVPG